MMKASVVYALIAFSLGVLSAPAFVYADVSLSSPAEGDAGMVLDADSASLFSVLDELSLRTGMVVKGRRHITDREISGRYQGDMQELLEALLTHESYLVVLRPEPSSDATSVEKIIFTGQSKRNLADPITPVGAPQKPRVAVQKPAKEPKRTENYAPPVAPQIDARILDAISRPPPGTPERRRFDAALEKTRNELEEALAPLRNLQ